MAKKFAYTKRSDAEKRMEEKGVSGKIKVKSAQARAGALKMFLKEGETNQALEKLLSSSTPVYIFEGDTPEDDLAYYGEDWLQSAARMKLTSDSLDIVRKKEEARLDANALKLVAEGMKQNAELTGQDSEEDSA